MPPDLSDQMREQMAGLSDEALERVVTTEAGNYREEALEIAREERRRRSSQPRVAAAVGVPVLAEPQPKWMKWFKYFVGYPMLIMMVALFLGGLMMFVGLNLRKLVSPGPQEPNARQTSFTDPPGK